MDSKIVQVALNGLENILRFGEQESKNSGGSNPYAVIIEEVFGLDKIEFLQVRSHHPNYCSWLISIILQSHENMEIYQKAFDIIERYFGTEEEDKDVSFYLSVSSWKWFFILHFYRLLLWLMQINFPLEQRGQGEMQTNSLNKASTSKLDSEQSL